MRENRPYGSEGGVGDSRSRPLSVGRELLPVRAIHHPAPVLPRAVHVGRRGGLDHLVHLARGDAPVVALEERAKCLAIAFACGFNQLAVIDWVTSGGRSLALLIHAGVGYITGNRACRMGKQALC